jgi:AAA+ superfamily predicted ATPase
MEQSRTIVHGAWGGIGGNPKSMKQILHNPFLESSIPGPSSSSSSSRNSLTLQGEVECWNDTRCSTVCAFAGPSGYGKRTLIRAIANDLQRSVQIVHISELLAGSGGGRKGGDLADTVDAVENLLQDARISDAVVGIDGFEHILEDNTATSHGGDSGMKLPLLLSRLLDIFTSFPGLIILICHIDNVQNLILHKEFASRIFSFIRFSVPSYEIRALLWRELIPPNAPMPAAATADEKSSIDYVELGRKFELGPRGIYNALSRACARVVTRIMKEKNEKTSTATTTSSTGETSSNLQICQKDLLAGGEAEIAKLRGGGNLDALSKMFS